MTERKPTGASWRSWIEHQITEGQRGGAFDDLVGAGKPIADIGVVHDEMWWVKAKLRDEEIDWLPPTIAIRAEREAAIDAALAAPDETTVRLVIDDLNRRIRYVNSHATAGPPSSVVVVDVEMILERWRVAHPAPEPTPPSSSPASAAEPAQRRRWWRRTRRA